MKRFNENMKAELVKKAWNYGTTALLVVAGLYWIICSDYGDFYKITGCAAYMSAAVLWIFKSSWAQSFLTRVIDAMDVESSK
jgi:hypothetical protein